MKWNPSLYDRNHGFVAEYGKALLTCIPENPDQSILDLGCGTGALTGQLAALGSRVMGVDSSPEMIEKARKNFPRLSFQVCDALNLPFEGEWDVIFSNAVFHWISDHDRLLENIKKALRPGGLLICEFGAAGNTGAILQAFGAAAAESGYPYQCRFNYQTPENFRLLLENHGFIPERVWDFQRPTPLAQGWEGLSVWLRQFLAAELSAMPPQVQDQVLARTEELARDLLWNGKEWVGDYRRLRAAARL